MDNLDRTNVAQAAIAKWTLDRQLKDLRVIQENDSVDNYEELTRDFRESTCRVDYVPFVSRRLIFGLQCGRITPTSFPLHTAARGP